MSGIARINCKNKDYLRDTTSQNLMEHIIVILRAHRGFFSFQVKGSAVRFVTVYILFPAFYIPENGQ